MEILVSEDWEIEKKLPTTVKYHFRILSNETFRNLNNRAKSESYLLYYTFKAVRKKGAIKNEL